MFSVDHRIEVIDRIVLDFAGGLSRSPPASRETAEATVVATVVTKAELICSSMVVAPVSVISVRSRSSSR